MAWNFQLWSLLFCIKVSDVITNGRLGGPDDSCNLEASCFQQHFGRCKCDDVCSFYNDCCFDATSATTETAKRGAQSGMEIQCLPLATSSRPDGVYAVNRCTRFWSGPSIVKTKCENQNDFSDPLMSIPATDIHTNITYRNRYCSECNNADADNLSSWLAIVTCDSLLNVNISHRNITEDFILQNIIRVGNSWGVHHWDQSRGGIAFFPCAISFSLPNQLYFLVRSCYTEMVSQCVPGWRGNLIQSHCSSHMSVVFDANGKVYRNSYCADCNNIPRDKIKCVGGGPYGSGGGAYGSGGGAYGFGVPTLNMAVIVDVHPSDGNKVGYKESCPSGQIFDPFIKKCRSLVCAIPGFVRRNNQCVRQ